MNDHLTDEQREIAAFVDVWLATAMQPVTRRAVEHCQTLLEALNDARGKLAAVREVVAGDYPNWRVKLDRILHGESEVT